jgi:isopentenyl diphosphate isomerase/L-lactate dehydrogenase-like FMN-dependent dehydrogenase
MIGNDNRCRSYVHGAASIFAGQHSLDDNWTFPDFADPTESSQVMVELARAEATSCNAIGPFPGCEDVPTHKRSHAIAVIALSGPVWYQLYLLGGRKAAEPAIERAHNAGFSGLVVTIDTAVAGLRGGRLPFY